MNKKEALKFLKVFMNKVATQDNRATAFPYFYVIKNRRISKIIPYDGEGNALYREEESLFKSKQEFEDSLLGEGCSKEEIIERKNNLEKVSAIIEEVDEGLFFTEEAAKSHLAQNHYHYSEDAYVYLKHAWRCPEMKDVFEALEVLTEEKVKR